jgi:alpha-tubulin suppressor-like RCC1 family protein
MSTQSRSIVLLSAVTFVLGLDVSTAYGQGVLRAWGSNQFGQFGNGATASSSVPVPAGQGLRNVVAVACGRRHAVALLQDGSVWAWGSNNSGQLGNGSFQPSLVPVPVTGLSDVVGIAAGHDTSFAILSDGTVRGWGESILGAVGHSPVVFRGHSTPVSVDGLSSATQVSIGSSQWGIAARTDGNAWGWGYDFCSQIGPITTSTVIPAQPTGYSSVIAVAAGGCHSVALQDNGVVKAMGANDAGQLGNGGIPNISSVPVTATGAGLAIAVAAGSTHSMSLRSNGTVRAWGNNSSGQLGTGSITSSVVPVAVSGLTSIIAIDANMNHSFALRDDNRVFMWGANASGQLGIGTTSNSNIPLMVNVHAIGGQCGEDFVIVIANPPPCPADISPTALPNAVVDMDDLLAVIGAWNSSQSPADIDHSGTVDIDDLLMVINAWGECPA